MSGIYIPGMEMPKSCYDCPLQDDECFGSIKCCYTKTWGSANKRAVDCPLIPVPDYGPMIDVACHNCGCKIHIDISINPAEEAT